MKQARKAIQNMVSLANKRLNKDNKLSLENNYIPVWSFEEGIGSRNEFKRGFRIRDRYSKKNQSLKSNDSSFKF